MGDVTGDQPAGRVNSAPATATELYKRLLGYATPHWRLFILAVLAMTLFAATDTGFAALMKPMLDGNFSRIRITS